MITEKLHITDDPSVTLTTYIYDLSPEMPGTAKRPAMLILPGGGYEFCSDREAEPVALAYMAEGFNAFVLRYTVKEKAVFPRPLEDAEAALETIIANADEWRVDASKIAVIGFSAGGHLAAALSVMGKVRPAASILGYPCILESMSSVLFNPMPGLDDKVTDKTPPTFLFHTFEDDLVPVANALKYALALEANHVPFELHVFQHGGHGLSLGNPLTSWHAPDRVERIAGAWFKMSVEWLFGLFGEHDYIEGMAI